MDFDVDMNVFTTTDLNHRVTLTFDLQHLITSSVAASEYSSSVLSNIVQVVHK